MVAWVASLPLAVLLLAAPANGQGLFGEKKYDYQPSDVLPAATEFVEKETYWEGYGSTPDDARAIVGYVFLTDDLVEVPGYSGHTINTLVGMDPRGKITGIKIVKHSEPIVLIGLSEKVIHDFVAQYLGKDIRERIIISDSPREGYTAFDGISGATVTAVAENVTIIKAALQVGRAVGIIAAHEIRSQRPSQAFTAATWGELAASGAIGHLVVKPEEIEQVGDEPVIDLVYAVLDPPSIGKNLLGERYYEVVRERLARDGGSAIYVAADGEISFKGGGFARGGIFDRFSIEQRGATFVFKDLDQINFTDLAIDGSPEIREGGIFFLRDPVFDPTEKLTFHLTLPFRTRDKRVYRTFLDDYQLPRKFIDKDVPFWVTRWQESAPSIIAFASFLALVCLAFAFRPRLVEHRKLIHRSVAVIAAVWVGWILKAQPSTTQILTAANSGARGKFPFEIFLAEPLIFLFWIVIAVTLVVWGRGFFCGWMCPYGALLETLISVWQSVAPKALQHKFETWEPGPRWRRGKYVTFLIILAVGFVNLPAAEMLDEVEPFKSFVLHLVRPWYFVAYFVVITLVSVPFYRFFCRFLCPLGGALALTGRKPALPLLRYQSCTTCKICHKGCEPKAISYETGIIDYAECLQCWDCQKQAQSPDVCPELIIAARDKTAPRVLFSALLLGLLLTPPTADGKTWTVSASSGTIGAAIAASAEGDTVQIRAGVYREHVVVDKPLSIVGDEGAVVDAEGTGNVLVIDAPNVHIEGLTLRGCGVNIQQSDAGIRIEKRAADAEVVGNTIQGCRFGVWIHGSERVKVKDNDIVGVAELPRGDRGDCIHLWDAKHASIDGNTLSECRDGVYMELSTDCEITRNTITNSRYSVHTMWCDRSTYNENTATNNMVGLALMFSKRITANGNILHKNTTHGILLTQVTRSEVLNNIIIGNSKGIFVYNSLYNKIQGNLVARNNLGLHYWGGSEDNELLDNGFVGNEIQVKFVASHDQSWDGNYWSDYVGWDSDGDGHGEAPYRSNTLVDALLWKYPIAKVLLASPALQVLALAEREFPVITVPKGVDRNPRMAPAMPDWATQLARYPGPPPHYYGAVEKLPHIPGE